MSKIISLSMAILLALYTCFPVEGHQAVAAKSIQQSQNNPAILSSQDIVNLIKGNLSNEVIIAKIRSSPNDFVISAETLNQLKAVGVPDEVILAMVEAKESNSSMQGVDSIRRENCVLQVPDGTVIEVEAPYTINSLDFKTNDRLSFRVVNPVKIDGVTVIEQGATVTASIEKSKRGGHFGKAGLLLWMMQTVTAVDGSQVALRNSQAHVRGDSKAAKVATGMIITGVLLWPIAPVVLLHGFKRGENAFIPAGKRYQVLVNGQATVKSN